MIVDEDVVQQIVQFDANEVAPTLRGKLVPVPFPTRTDLLQHFGIHVQLVLVDVCIEVVRAQHLRNATQLVDVPVRSEEGNLVEHESGDHASKRPDVNGIVVVLGVRRTTHPYVIVRQELRTLVVTRANTHVELLLSKSRDCLIRTWIVEVRQTPVNNVRVVRVDVNQNVLRLQVAMHDPVAVRVVETHQYLVHVIAELVVA